MSGFDVEDLAGKKLVSQDGMDVGEITSFVLDVDVWTVLSVVVKVDRKALETLKLRRPLLGSQKILIPVREISGVGQFVVLESKLDELTFFGGEPEEASVPVEDATLPPEDSS